MIELINVTKEYGGTPVLKNISLRIDEPGIYCLLGRNGAGKTTLLKSVAGYQNITGGEIRVDGKPVTTAALETGVSYIENFARHFNLPVRRLLRIASRMNPSFDEEFAWEMTERFELDGKKKFNHLSLGMKTMVSTIVCLASSKSVILLDEPVLGFDAIMRVEFYEMLAESFRKHPRIIIVSTHIIEEIAKTIQKLIIIDKGTIRFFDTLQAVEEKAFSISGLKNEVDAVTEKLHVIGQDIVGGLATSYVYDTLPADAGLSVEIQRLSLQDFFIQMVGHKGGKKS
ncbi:MAG TPA: ABC transporter ATP-binding protein [Firmicutes bacterium]|nr:ABC transporter ATP-binding protein [Bacillota bacterium]